jgi:predicted PurR-regulated permease PerM
MISKAADGDSTLNKAPRDPETPSEAVPAELPLPSDPKSIFLGGLFILGLLAVAYVARDIIVPLILAFVLNLLLQPALRLLDQLHVPRTASALLLIVALLAMIIGLVTAISGPAETWAAKLPQGITRLQERLSFVQAPINSLQRFLRQVEDFGQPKPSANAATQTQSPTLFTRLFAGTRNFAAGFFTTVLFLFFLLIAGDIFLLRLVEILPRFSGKRQVVEISKQIESDISVYLITITIMNAAVGTAMALVTWLTGVGDPIFWGTIAFLLNYVPILGTAVGAVIFLLAGLLTIDPLWQALLPVALYLGIHLIEGETVTPMLLAKRFTINPVLVIISLVFWFWMWGIPGMILAVPMLAITKIVCDRVQPLAAFGHFLEG